MTARSRPLTRTALTILTTTAALCAAGCAAPPPGQSQPGPRRTPECARPAARPAAPAGAALLPVTPARLHADATLAARFAAAYDTRQPAENPRTWLARLAPMSTPQLAAALARTAATTALWPPGRTEAAQATAIRARDITPESVIFTIRLRLAITAGTTHQAATAYLAVTTTAGSAGGWKVYDIEPATAGNN
jgi:lipoprotein-anchoring transpeptidase ErfK/SrfK